MFGGFFLELSHQLTDWCVLIVSFLYSFVSLIERVADVTRDPPETPAFVLETPLVVDFDDFFLSRKQEAAACLEERLLRKRFLWKYSEEEEHFLDDDDGTKESVHHHRLRASFHHSLCIFCRGALSRECFRRRRR